MARTLVIRSQAFALSLVNSPKRLFVVGVATNMVYVLLFFAFEQRSIGDSFWWGWVTGFTVGYGDVYPISVLGRVVGIASMATNFLLLTFLAAHIVVGMLVEENVFDEDEQTLSKRRAEDAARADTQQAASLRRIELALGTLPADAPMLPVFRTDAELLAEIRG